jgi:hypothetical protein
MAFVVDAAAVAAGRRSASITHLSKAVDNTSASITHLGVDSPRPDASQQDGGRRISFADTDGLFRDARIATYARIDQKYDKLALTVAGFSLAYTVLTVELIEAAWNSNHFDTASNEVLARQCVLALLTVVLFTLIYCEGVLERVNTMPGLDLSLCTLPNFTVASVTELLWNLMTSYPGTSPMFALPAMFLRVMYLFKLLRFEPLTKQSRFYAIQAGTSAPKQDSTTPLKAMLRKKPFPLIGMMMMLLVPMLGYMLLATQRWAYETSEDSALGEGGEGPSWLGEEYSLKDSIWAVLFMIAIAEPYDVSDNGADRMLALLTAVIAAILTTMLITALMQLIEADSSTEATLEDQANKQMAEELRNAAGDYLRVQFKVHQFKKARMLKAVGQERPGCRTIELINRYNEESNDPEDRLLFQEVLRVKQAFRAQLKTVQERQGADEAVDTHAKLQKIINQGGEVQAAVVRFKGQLFSKLNTQDCKRKQCFEHEEEALRAGLEHMEDLHNTKQAEMMHEIAQQRDDMEQRLTRLLESHSHAMREMEIRLDTKGDEMEIRRKQDRDRLHQEELNTLREIEDREIKMMQALHASELKAHEDSERQRVLEDLERHNSTLEHLGDMEEREQEERIKLHKQEMKAVKLAATGKLARR